MNGTPTFRRSVAGLSLIEMMVALTLSLVLMLGVIQVFTASQAASRLAEGAARVQENGRFAIDMLERDIRMAGHMGCVNDQAHIVKNLGDPRLHFTAGSGSGDPLDFSVAIQGYEAPDTGPGTSLTLGDNWDAPPDLPSSIADLTPAPVGGSDVLVLRFLASEGVPVDSISAAGAGSVLGVNAERWKRLTEGGVSSPTLFGIADCSHADVFEGTSSAGEVTSTNAELSRYTAQPTGQTMVYRAESMVYYIGLSDTGEPGLRRARADSTGAYTINEELVEGIESLQLMYGLDSTTDISVTAPPAGNITEQAVASGVTTDANAIGAAQWLRVGMVQVGLLARSPSPASATAPTNGPSALGVTFNAADAPDGRYRTSYEVSVALRNRLFGN